MRHQQSRVVLPGQTEKEQMVRMSGCWVGRGVGLKGQEEEPWWKEKRVQERHERVLMQNQRT